MHLSLALQSPDSVTEESYTTSIMQNIVINPEDTILFKPINVK